MQEEKKNNEDQYDTDSTHSNAEFNLLHGQKKKKNYQVLELPRRINNVFAQSQEMQTQSITM